MNAADPQIAAQIPETISNQRAYANFARSKTPIARSMSDKATGRTPQQQVDHDCSEKIDCDRHWPDRLIILPEDGKERLCAQCPLGGLSAHFFMFHSASRGFQVFDQRHHLVDVPPPGCDAFLRQRTHPRIGDMRALRHENGGKSEIAYPFSASFGSL